MQTSTNQKKVGGNYYLLIMMMIISSFSSLTSFSQTYFTEGFESQFTPNTSAGPNAPATWTQTRLGTLTSTPGTPGVSGQRDWAQSVNTGSSNVWASNTLPNAAQAPYNGTITQLPASCFAGTGAAWFNDGYAAGSGTTGQNIRRLESPVINLSTSTNPQVQFTYALYAGSCTMDLVASADGGTNWNVIGSYANLSSTSAWSTKVVTLPAIYKVANAKIGFVANNTWGSYDLFLDAVSVREFITPDAAPISFTAASITQTGMTIGWTDNSTNELGFRVYRSTDNVSFTQVGTDISTTTMATTGTTYSSVQTGLTVGTTYYYRIATLGDVESAYLTGSQATSPPGNFVSTGTGGNWSATGTWVGGVVPTVNDNVTIADGATVTVDVTTAVAFSVTVGSGAGSPAILQYDGTTVGKTLTVGAGGVIINANGTVRSNTVNPASLASHTLSIGGSFTLNGAAVFNGSATANSKANIIFTGATNNSFTTSATSTLTINTVTINKGTAIANTLDFNPGTSWTATAGSQGFAISNGTLKISGTTTISSPVFNAAAYSIPTTGGFWLNNANFTVTAQNGSPTNTGLLRISAGIYNIGTAAGNAMSGATGQYNIEGGILNIGSRITCSGAGSYTQSGGIVNVTTVALGNTSTSTGGLDFSSATSSVTISAGVINLVQANSSATPLDFRFTSSTINITGGTLNVGTTATATNFTFRISGATPAIVIDNTTTNKLLNLFAASTVYGSVTINTGTTLNTNAFNLGLRGAITNNGTLTANAVGSGLTFQGSAAQTLDLGTAITSNQIANVIVNNAAGVTITPSVQINTALTLTAGNLSSGGTLTLGAAAATSFTFINSGGSLSGTVTKNYGTGTNNFTYNGTLAQVTGLALPAAVATGTLTINNAAGVTLNSPLSIQLLALTAGKLTTTTTNLLTVTGTTTGSITGGSTTAYINGPLARTLPASTTTGTWAWPLGKTAYQLFEIIAPTINAAGPVVVQVESFDANPGGTYTSLVSLTNNRYWQVSPVTGTGAFTAAGSVRLTETGLVLATKVGQSVAAAANGTYTNNGGTVVIGTPGTVTSTVALANYGTGANSTFFVTGLPGAFSAGIYAVGPTANGSTLQPDGITLYDGFYPTLTAAMTAINGASPSAGNVIFELQNDYVSTSETLPITSTYQGTASSKLTIRPRSDNATPLTISGTNATAAIDLNTAKFVIIDGRPGATGSSKALTIGNTNAAGPAIRFINDATDNIVRYATIKSENVSATSGTIVFSTAGPTTGNDNNTIDNNDIIDGTITPLNAIYSAGTSVALDNGGNTVSNCNIANYFGVATASNGIYLASNSAAWTISSNKFYQGATRTATTGTVNRAIQIVTSSGGGYTITNNTIGFANAAGTGTTTYTGTVSRFIGMDITAANTPVSSIQGNTVANISVTSTSAGSTSVPVFGGINILAGGFNIGTVTGNTIGAATGTGSIAVSGSSTSFFVNGISVTSTGTVNIKGNTVGSINAAGNAATIGCQFYGIWAAGSAGNFTIASNTVGSTTTANSIVIGTDLTTTASSTNQNFYGIRCDATGTTVVGGLGLGNTIQNVALRSSGSAAFYGYYNGGSATAASYTYNTLTDGIAHGWTTTNSTGTFYGFYNTSTVSGLLTISNNNFQNLTSLNTTGSIYIMYNSSSTNTANVQNNTLNNISRAATATSGTLYCYYNGSSPGGIQNVNDNVFTNITSGATGGTTGFYGIYNLSSSSSSWNIYNNNISTITAGSGTSYCIYNGYGTSPAYNNSINNISTGGTIYGLYLSSSLTTASYYSNVIHTLSSTGTSSSIYGIYAAGGTALSVYKNKLYNFSENGTGGTTYGIYAAGPTTLNIYNNLVGDLKAPSSSLTAPAPSVVGLYLSSGTTINAYYNTFNVTATSTGTNFGTAVVYATSSPTTINLRNNIFYNGSTPAGTGKTIAYQRANTTLGNYANTSNNNLFYAGTPGANNLIYYDGTNSDQTLGAFKSRMATRDAASVTQNVTFLSTTGSSSNFLHIDTATPSLAESGATTIATFTDDYDGDARNATTPDIGADEFNGTAPVVVTVNTATASPTGNACAATSRTITATTTAGTTDLTSVVLSYSFNNGTPVLVTMTGGTLTAGSSSSWTAVIPAATPTNATVTWFVTATDGVSNGSKSGTTYKDDPLLAVTATLTATPSNVCANTGSVLTATLNGLISPYCTPVVVGTPGASGDYLNNFTFADITNNASGDAASDYTYYSALTAHVVANGTTTYNVSLGTGGSSSTYTQQFRIWIDYNQNGIFEPSESVYNTTTATYVGGGAPVNTTVTIPNTAYNGITRMRVASRYSTIVGDDQACQIGTASTGAWGEFEDYNISITGGQTNTTLATYSWSDGTGVVGTTNPVTVIPTSTTNYTLTITASGCTKSFSPVTVTTIGLPPAPNVNNSAQCGDHVPTAFVTSAFDGVTNTSTGAFKWYAAQTGGTALQTGGTTYTGSINTTTHLWVSESNGTCESLRSDLLVTVNTPDAVLAAVNNNNPCANTAIQLTGSNTAGSPTNSYSYSWSASPQPGSGLAAGLTPGSPLVITPTAGNTYTYTLTAIDGSCAATSTVVVTVKPQPVLNATTATPPVICEGATSTIGVTTTSIIASTVALGTGTSSYASSAFPAVPYANYDEGGNNEILVRASELTALGLSAGNITSLAFNVSSLNSSGVHKGYTIKIKNTGLTALTAFDLTSMTTVFGPVNYQPVSGSNTHVFTTPFNWDGTSNILIDICFDNEPTSAGGTNYTNNALTTFTTTAYNSIVYYNADGTGSNRDMCGVPAGTNLGTSRPNMVFGGQVAVTGGGSLNYVWNPGSVSGNSQIVTPTSTTVYTVTATNPSTTCISTATATVNVNPAPPAPSGSNGTDQCGTAITDASVSSQNVTDPQSPAFFKWYLVPTGGTAVQTGTATTYQTAISATTDFYVSEVSTNGCEGSRVHISTIVSDPDVLNVIATPSTVCAGSSFNISSSYTANFNSFATFDLTATGGAASGVTGTISLTPNGTLDGSDPYTVTPTATGTYTYTITAVDPDKGCTSIGTAVVTVGPVPTITSATATPGTICEGASTTLNGQSLIGGPGTAAVGTQSTTEFGGGVYRLGFGTGDFRHQLLFTAAELTAAGFTSGNITGLKFNVTSVGSGSANNYTIKLGNTGATVLGTSFTSATFTTCYTAATYTPVTGVNTHNFTTPFNWDGTSNLLIDICYNVSVIGTSSTLAANTPAFLANNQLLGTAGACAATTGASTFANRPIVTLNGVIGNNQTGSYNWSWTPGSLSGASVTVSPTTTTIYTVTATNPATNCSSTQTVTVTVNPLPAAPTSSNVSRCGPGSVTLSASGAGTLHWYDVASGGTSLQTGGTYTTNVTGNISFWVASTSDAGCEGPRTQVNVTVTTPPILVITPSGATTLCLNSSITLNGASGSHASYINFAWIANPSTGSGLSAATGSSITMTPTAAGTYTITLTANDGSPTGCGNIATLVVTVNPNPVVTTVTATPSTICATGAATLNGTSIDGAVGTAQVGTQASVNITPSPYRGGSGSDCRNQMLYTAAELHAAGVAAGPITSIAFNNSTSPSTAVNQLTISIGATSATSLGTTYDTSPTTAVWGPINFIPVLGVNTHTFSSAFVWDGVSSIIVNTCSPGGGGTSYNVSIGSVTGRTIQTASSGACTSTSGTSYNQVVATFGGIVGTDVTANYNWVWNPGAVTGSTANVNPTVTTVYTATVTNPSTGCFTVSSPVTVNVTPVGANATATPSTPVCVGTSVTLNSNPTGGAPFTYSWASTPSGTYLPNPSITVTPAVTTTYTVTVTDACSNSTTSSVTVTVNQLPTASIQEGPGPLVVCDPATQVLTAVTNAGSASYQWTLNGANITLNGTGSTYTVSGVGTGTYRVIVTNTATGCVSAASTGVVVTINAKPSTVSITPPSATICNGSNTLLTASGGTTGGSATAQIGAGATTITGATTSLGSPYNHWYGGIKQQMIYTKAELNAVGITAGNISALSFELTALGTSTLNMPNFTINVGHTTQSAATTTLITTGLTQVYSNAAQGVVLGINNYTFTTPFNYNNTDNIVVSICWSEVNSGVTAAIPTIKVDAAPFTATSYIYADNTAVSALFAASSNTSSGVGSTSQTATTATRPKIVFAYSSLQSPTWSWLPAAGLSATNTAAVTASPSATTTYTATATSPAGCTNSSTVTVTVNPRPTATISGSGAFCQGAANTSTNLTLTFTGTAPWNYTYSDGTTPVSGTTSSNPLTVTVAPSSAAPHLFTYTITALSDAVCTSIAADLTGSGTVTINPLAATPTASVVQPTCALGTGTITVTAPVGTGNSYTLDGVTTISWPSVSFAGVSPGTHSLTVTNSFGCSAPASASVVVNPQPFTPGAPVVTGIINVCPYLGTLEQLTYTAAVTGNGTTTYSWILPPNVNVIAGGGTNSANNFVTLTFNTAFGNPPPLGQPNRQIRVTAQNECGTSAQTIYYLQAQSPMTPGPITGPTNVCALIGTATTATYTINRALSATLYSWSVPANAVIMSHPGGNPGANDTIITVRFDAGFTGGPITVTAGNGCGNSTTRSLAIGFTAPAQPGLISGPTNVCANIAPGGVATTYSIAPVLFATSYTWTVSPATATVTHPNGSGINDNTITVLLPAGFTTGSVSVFAHNGCGDGTSRVLTLNKLTPSTPSVIDVIQTHFCGDAPDVNGNARAFTYTLSAMPANAASIQWTIPTAPGVVLVSGQGTISITVSYPDGAVTGTVTAQAVSNCGTSAIRSTAVRLPACPPPGFAGNNNGNNNGSVQTKGGVVPGVEKAASMEVKIFPNPTVSDFKLEVLTSQKEEINVRVLDGQGRLYKAFKLMPYQAIALGAELKAGSYLVEVRQGDQVKTTKVIKF